jgi:hypothetical protein
MSRPGTSIHEVMTAWTAEVESRWPQLRAAVRPMASAGGLGAWTCVIDAGDVDKHCVEIEARLDYEEQVGVRVTFSAAEWTYDHYSSDLSVEQSEVRVLRRDRGLDAATEQFAVGRMLRQFLRANRNAIESAVARLTRSND